MALDQERIHGEFEFLETVQEMIYNQLLALKGEAFESVLLQNIHVSQWFPPIAYSAIVCASSLVKA